MFKFGTYIIFQEEVILYISFSKVHKLGNLLLLVKVTEKMLHCHQCCNIKAFEIIVLDSSNSLHNNRLQKQILFALSISVTMV